MRRISNLAAIVLLAPCAWGGLAHAGIITDYSGFQSGDILIDFGSRPNGTAIPGTFDNTFTFTIAYRVGATGDPSPFPGVNFRSYFNPAFGNLNPPTGTPVGILNSWGPKPIVGSNAVQGVVNTGGSGTTFGSDGRTFMQILFDSPLPRAGIWVTGGNAILPASDGRFIDFFHDSTLLSTITLPSRNAFSGYDLAAFADPSGITEIQFRGSTTQPVGGIVFTDLILGETPHAAEYPTAWTLCSRGLVACGASASIPEPSGAALVLAGLALIGTRLLRRRRGD